MIQRLFRRRPDARAAIFAEAQALVDDGLGLSFVLGLYPADADWLEPLLDTGLVIGETFAAVEPSYYFEASLKTRFLAAAREKLEPGAVTPFQRIRTAFAAAGVMAAAGALGALTLGMVTAGSAVPGDWNYTFKLANERMQYSLSRGNDRVNVQLSHTETRVQEIVQLSSRGDVSPGDLSKLQREAEDLRSQLERSQLDEAQRARIKSLAETSAAVLADLRARQADLDNAVASTKRALDDTAAAAGVGSVSTVTPIATATPTASPTATASPSASPSPSPAASGTPAPSTTPQPSPSATSTP